MRRQRILLFSPFKVFFCYVAPAVSADRVKFTLIVDVDFDFCASAFSVPRVFAVFNWATWAFGVFQEVSLFFDYFGGGAFKTLDATTTHKAERLK